MKTVKTVSKEKIKIICRLLENLSIYEKAHIINLLSDDIEVTTGETLSSDKLKQMIKD